MKPQRYGPFEYSPIISRKPLRWPNNARVALWVIPNIEFFPLDTPTGTGSGRKVPPPDVMAWSTRDYGNRVGVFRIMDVLERYGIRATVALNSDICLEHPIIVDEGLKRKWEFMGHTKTNAFRLNELPPGEEPKLIREVLATIHKKTGVKVEGWLGAGLAETWDTLDILAAEGCSYVADWFNDDQPYLMNLEDGRSLVAVPYAGEVNDKMALDHWYMTAAEFSDMIRRQFDVLWREGEENGRVMAIAVHPYITGVPHRIGHFDAALEHICRHEGVWLATGAEIAKYYLSQIADTHSGSQKT